VIGAVATTTVATYFAVTALTTVPAGRLVERYGSRITTRASIVIAAISMVAIALGARSYGTLVAALVFGASANSLGQIASNASLARCVPPHRQGVSFGAKQASVPLATLIAGATVPVIALTIGWRWAFVVAAVLTVGALATAPADADAPRDSAKASRGKRVSTPLLVLGLAGALAAGSANGLATFLVASAVHRGIGAASAGATLTFGSAIGIVARLAGGWLADRRSGGHIRVVAIMLALGAVGMVLLAVPGTWALLIGTALGFGLGWSWPGVLNFAVIRMNPSAPASATAITQSGVYAGGVFGPIGFGFVATNWSYPVAWLVNGAVMVIAAGLMFLGSAKLRARRTSDSLARNSPMRVSPP
jgi:MFS family permease